MLQGEHSAILSTFLKLPFVIKIFALSSFEWPFYTGFTVILTCVLGAQKNHLIDRVIFNIHNLCFVLEIKYKILHTFI